MADKPLKNQKEQDVVNDAPESVQLKDVMAELAELRRINKETEDRWKQSVIKPTPDKFNPLSNRTIVIKPVEKKANMVIQDKSEATWLTGTKRTYGAQMLDNGRINNPLTSEEQEFFEKLLNIKLSTDLDTLHNFWATKASRITVHKTSRDLDSATITLNLSSPYDYILYKVALAHDRIANNLKALSVNPLYEMVIVDDNEVLANTLDEIEVEDRVNSYLLANKNNKKVLFDLLRLYGVGGPGKRVSLDTPVEKLYAEIKTLVREKYALNKINNLLTLEPTRTAIKVLIQDAITFGLINVNGNEYTMQGGQLIARSLDGAEEYFSTPERQSLKLSLEEQVKRHLKTKL